MYGCRVAFIILFLVNTDTNPFFFFFLFFFLSFSFPFFPLKADLSVLEDIEVEYETLPGWQTDISAVRRWEDLPANAQAYIQRIEDLVGVPGMCFLLATWRVVTDV